jgi:hypothetical protein
LLDLDLAFAVPVNPSRGLTVADALFQSYCVGAPGGCADIYTIVSGDNCSGIETKFGITAAQLQSLNPWLDANCGTSMTCIDLRADPDPHRIDLQVGQNLCV